MNTLIPGAIWKSFGVIFLEVKAKYGASAAFLSWTSSMVMALALFMGNVLLALCNIGHNTLFIGVVIAVVVMLVCDLLLLLLVL